MGILKNAKLTPRKNKSEFGVTVEDVTLFMGQRLVDTFATAFSILSMAPVLSYSSVPRAYNRLKYV